MLYMYGVKAAAEIRDREVRKQAKAKAQEYLDSLDDEDRRSAQNALEEMFSLPLRAHRQAVHQKVAEQLRSQRQQAAGAGGNLSEMFGLGRLF